MSCVRGSIDDVFFVRWLKPEVEDAAAIVADVKKLQEDRGTPVQYVAVIGKDTDPPEEAVRESMRRNIDELLQYCATVHLVIEGKGFRKAAMRSIGTGIFLLSRNRGRTFAHDTVERALARIGRPPAEIEQVLARAREQELVV